MTSSFNALLSDIYRILSLYDADDFVEASRSRRVDPLLKDVLRALARSARIGGGSKERVQRNVQSLYRSESDNGDIHSDLLEVITKVISDASADKVIEIFGRNGALIEKRPKESKDRLAKRLVSVANLIGSSRRRKLLGDLADASGSQTAGWINVLRNRS